MTAHWPHTTPYSASCIALYCEQLLGTLGADRAIGARNMCRVARAGSSARYAVQTKGCESAGVPSLHVSLSIVPSLRPRTFLASALSLSA